MKCRDVLNQRNNRHTGAGHTINSKLNVELAKAAATRIFPENIHFNAEVRPDANAAMSS